MKYYIEITLQPSAEIPLHFLWEKLYQQVHLALVEMQEDDGKVAVGVSFPQYDEKRNQLGSTLRLFGLTIQELEQLDLTKWLSRLMDYVHMTTIRDVPANCRFSLFKRLQPVKSNAKKIRMAKRKAKRENISIEEAFELLGKHKEEIIKAPFINIKSLSSEQRYRLLIGKMSSKDYCQGKFSTYGLSSVATVPIF